MEGPLIKFQFDTLYLPIRKFTTPSPEKPKAPTPKKRKDENYFFPLFYQRKQTKSSMHRKKQKIPRGLANLLYLGKKKNTYQNQSNNAKKNLFSFGNRFEKLKKLRSGVKKINQAQKTSLFY